MSDDDQQFDDVEARFQQLFDGISEARRNEKAKTGIRLCHEGKRIAKETNRLIPYLHCAFELMMYCESLGECKLGCDNAVETIAFLENEDRARQFDPQLNDEHYEYTRSWMTARVYKALAQMTGMMHGYNSPGLHNCIADGINVCRRTGDTDSILMFREFAVEVYRAADDIDLAIHFARESLQTQGGDENRKVASADDVAKLLALQGRFRESAEMIVEGWEYCEQFHTPYLAHINFVPLAREVAALAGRADILEQFPIIIRSDVETDLPEGRYVRYPDRHENSGYEQRYRRHEAMELACRGDFQGAIDCLRTMDNLLQGNDLDHWFAIRCRLVAAYRLNGQMDLARKLAKHCVPFAEKANDWLTLRRLERLMDESIPANPLATLEPPDCGPFAVTKTSVAFDSTKELSGSPNAGSNSSDPAVGMEKPDDSRMLPSDVPLSPIVEEFYERLQNCEGNEEVIEQIRKDLFGTQPDSAGTADDCQHLIHLATFLIDPDCIESALLWAQGLMKHFPQSDELQSMFATFASRLLAADEKAIGTLVTWDQITSLFRESIDRNPKSAKNYGRAGNHFLSLGEYGDAERCLARAFRLDRTYAMASLGLAQVYASTERPRDALAVLDMALREGCDDPRIAWEAALHAKSLDQFTSMLTYLDHYDQQMPDEPWSNYYRGFAYVELLRPKEALKALEREAEINPEAEYPIKLLQTCALGQLDKVEEFSMGLTEILEIPLKTVDSLSHAGLAQLFRRLWITSKCLPSRNPLREKLDQRLLCCCLTPDDSFEATRIAKPEASEQVVQFFRVILQQPLDERWKDSEGCLLGEEEWKSYNIMWTVLAVDEEDAVRQATEIQGACYSIPAEVLNVQFIEQQYRDFAGVVSQGPRAEGVDDPEEGNQGDNPSMNS
jgi:tetratricopeptide (TPR) repeat protein